MATAAPDAAIVTLLDAITSPVALVPNVNLILGPILPPAATVRGKCVFVTATGGPDNYRYCGVAHDHQRATVQVSIRADVADYAGGQALARACWSACHCPTLPSGYTDVQVREPDPYYLRMDASGFHLWAFNVILVRDT
jgi:hypothetical protein